LFDINDLDILESQGHNDFFIPGNGDVINIVVHQIVRLSDLIIPGALDSDHLPVVFYVLDYAETRNHSDLLEKLRDRERFQSLDADIL
jgi:hypothetical protein